MLTHDMRMYYEDDAGDLSEDAVLVDRHMMSIPLDYVTKPCSLPNKLVYIGDDNSPHEFTPEV